MSSEVTAATAKARLFRPTSKDDEHLGFRKRPSVRWFSPPTLARAAAKVLLSAAFGDYLDKRELQSSSPAVIHEIDPGAEILWVDFVADTGDGFDPTYSVAWAMAQKTIRIGGPDGPTLPRADLVVLGGDEVYPYATATEYHDRFEGPLRAALPWTEPLPNRPIDPEPSQPDLQAVSTVNPVMVAIPGNHDWYDGLTGFMRLFAQLGWIGGRQLIQRRSYFALLLPGRNWLWGIDIQSDAYVDAGQLEYFRTAATRMASDDRLIICTAKPSWIDIPDDPQVYKNDPPSYRNLKKIESLVPDEVRVVLMLSGDSHHYARYTTNAPDGGSAIRMKVTSGGGGAFLSNTHTLDQEIDVPRRQPPTDHAQQPIERFTLQACYPSARQSRRLSWRTLLLPVRNWTFLPITGLLYVLLFVASYSRLTATNDDLALRHSPGYLDVLATFAAGPNPIFIVVLFAMISAFFVIPKRVGVWPARCARSAVGLVQTCCHLAAQAGLAMVILAQVQDWRGSPGVIDSPAVAIAAGAAGSIMLMLVLGSIVGSIIFAGFLCAVFRSANWNDTEAFSAFRHTGYKNFLRMRITASEIKIYPIGIQRTCSDWRIDPKKQADEDSWLQPVAGKEIALRLIEEPYDIR